MNIKQESLEVGTPTSNGKVVNLKTAKPTVRIETITPKKAAEMLQTNTHNRGLRQDRVTRLAGNIDRGEWRLTGAAIVFDLDGVLLDGQHRLEACVAADKPIEVIVLRNLPRENQDVMDDTMVRRLGDALSLRGETDVHRLGGTIAWYARLVYAEITGVPHYANNAVRPSIPQLLQFYADHPGLRDALLSTTPVLRALKLRPSPLGAVWYRFSLIDEEQCALFFDQLRTGANLDEESPILLFRRYCENERDGRIRRRNPDWRWTAICVKAWNAWREQRPVRALTYVYSPVQKERWPEPV